MPVRVEIHSSVVSRGPPGRALVTTRLPRALPTPTILPPGRRSTRPALGRSVRRAESALCRSSVRPAPVREMPRRAFSTPLARELPCPITTEPPHAEQEGTPVVLGVHACPSPRAACGRRIPAAILPRTSPVIGGADHAEDLTRHPLGRLEDDVAGEAVRHEHVGHAATDVPALDVPDEAEPGDSPMSRYASLARSLPLPGSSPTLRVRLGPRRQARSSVWRTRHQE